MGRILANHGAKRPSKIYDRNCKKIDRKLLAENGGIIKMDVSHETISKIFSEQLRRLPISGGDELQGQP